MNNGVVLIALITLLILNVAFAVVNLAAGNLVGLANVAASGVLVWAIVRVFDTV